MAKILVADDDDAILNVIEHRFKGKHAIIPARRGNIALALLQQQQVDLMLLDQNMPNIDGLETFRMLKENLAAPPPVIMMTAFGNPDLVIAFMKAGGADYINKPFDFDILEIKILRALERGAMERTRSGRCEGLDAFFTGAPDGFCITDLKGEIVMVNPTFETLLCETREALTGQHLAEVIHHDDLITVKKELEKLAGHEDTAWFESRVLCGSETVKRVIWSASADRSNSRIYLTARESADLENGKLFL